MPQLKRLMLISLFLYLSACGQKGALLYPAPEPEAESEQQTNQTTLLMQQAGDLYKLEQENNQ